MRTDVYIYIFYLRAKHRYKTLPIKHDHFDFYIYFIRLYSTGMNVGYGDMRIILYSNHDSSPRMEELEVLESQNIYGEKKEEKRKRKMK